MDLKFYYRKCDYMKILVGSKNPGKIAGTEQAFLKFYKDCEIEGIPVDSMVSDEPVDDEIYQGARNRVDNLIKYAKENGIEADFYAGVESGITNRLGKWIIVNVAVIKDNNGFESWGTSPGFPVPDRYVDRIIKEDLGTVMDDIFNEKELRKGKGGISFLTHDVISRIDLTKDAFVMALTMFVNDDIWK